MSVVQYKKYFWLVDTIRSAGKITKEQIDRKWSGSRYNDSHETSIPDTSFYRIRRDIEELFDIEILCNRTTGCYYIDESDLNSKTKQWLLSQFAVNQSLDASRELRDSIIYESIPEGTQYLTTIVTAISESRMLLCTHKRFDSDAPHVFYLSPLCLKVFKQRWYVLGICTELDGTIDQKSPKIYSLDRVVSLEMMEKTFKRPKNFNARAYFAPFYGVFCGRDYQAEFIRVRVVSETDAKYLRSLPLHASQHEPEPCIFEWYVAPTYDFVQQLRTYGANIEVLAPKSLRDKFAEEARKLCEMYGEIEN
ncbi:MAG: WYL domain-containing protein [Paludibacteraceae bacterium]|nr:WYL domain-containing protein [Paludibacteraceae bacterium]